MNLFRIHIKPRSGTDDRAAIFRYCLDHRLLGVGWRVDGLANTDDWSVYEQAAEAEPVRRSIQQPRYIHANVTPGDLVWTRDPDGQYYLARVTTGWKYWTTPEGRELDIGIANVFGCDIREVARDAVPGTVVSSFNRGRSIQRIRDPGAQAGSRHLWNVCAGQQATVPNAKETHVDEQ